MNEIGFAETSISKIAKKAGVSAATIYIYYENKEDMLSKIYFES
ncbi:TetR/AcrR family transcriptional regulator [Paenibacillus physcomitrellae]|nr:TetR/AcrR family transcriptional regulator [Paenibacillus physcomitrellae]